METKIFVIFDKNIKESHWMLEPNDTKAKKISIDKWFQLYETGKCKVLQPLYEV